jgi:hypothetical protein
MDHKLETSEDLAGQAARLPETRAIRTMFSDIDGEVVNRLSEKYGQAVSPERLRRLQDLPVNFEKRANFDRSYEKDAGMPPPHAQEGTVFGYVRENSDESPHVSLDQEVMGVSVTDAHERLHQMAAPEAPTALGKGLNEGMTEYFAEDIVSNASERGAELPAMGAYPQETALVRNLAEIAGRESVEAAYFKGDIEALREKVDQSLGKGTLESFGAKAKEWKDLPPEGNGT